jgi:hypothetical protein
MPTRADGFIRYCLRLAPEALHVFEGTVKSWLFWVGVVAATIALAFNERWAGRLRLEGFPGWVGIVFMAVALVFALLLASYRMYAKEHSEVERLRGTARSIGDAPKMVAMLSAYAGSTIEDLAHLAMPEPERLAHQLRDILVAAQWTVAKIRGWGTSRVPKGIEIWCQDATNPPARALHLKNALAEDRQMVVFQTDAKLPLGVVHLKIGYGPEPV